MSISSNLSTDGGYYLPNDTSLSNCRWSHFTDILETPRHNVTWLLAPALDWFIRFSLFYNLNTSSEYLICNDSLNNFYEDDGDADSPKYCADILPHELTTLKWMLVPAIVISFCYCVWVCAKKERKIKFPKCLVNLPAWRCRWAEAALFCLISIRLSPLLLGHAYWRTPDYFHLPYVHIAFLNILHIVLVYFPLLACISRSDYILAPVSGIIYMSPLVWCSAISWKECFSTNPSQVVFRTPTVLCQLILFIKFFIDIGIYLEKKLQDKCQRNPSHDKDRSHYYIQYTYDLCNRHRYPRPKRIWKRALLYFKDVIGFHYSAKVICTLVASIVALTKAFICVERWRLGWYSYANVQLQAWSPILHLTSNTTAVYNFMEDFINSMNVSVAVSSQVSFGLHIVFISQMLLSYRDHMKKLYKGDKSWFTPVSLKGTMSLQYPGFQIGYVVFGYLILGGDGFIFAMIFGMGISFLVKHHIHSSIGAGFVDLWPGLVSGIVITFLQTLVLKLILQKKNNMLIRYRFPHELLSYMMTYIHVVLGMLSCFQRALMTIILWGTMQCRLDRYAMSRTLERRDPGVESYLSMLESDRQHAHPVMLTFVHLLQKQTIDTTPGEPCTAESGLLVNEQIQRVNHSTKYRNKWFKVVTLINNPELQKCNKSIHMES